MPQDDMPLDDMTVTEMVREGLGHLRYLRRVLSEFEPLLSAVRGNGSGDAVRAAGAWRAGRAIRKGNRDASTPASR